MSFAIEISIFIVMCWTFLFSVMYMVAGIRALWRCWSGRKG